MSQFTLSFLVGIVMAFTVTAGTEKAFAEAESLAGEWRFAADPKDEGLKQEWYKTRLADTIRLPGTTAEQGKGEKNEKRDIYLWSPLYNSLPSAWYQRDVKIPAEWAGQRVILELERTKYTRVWVDGKIAGEQSGVCTPQEYDLTDAMSPGDHVLTIQVAIDPFPKGIGGHHLRHLQTNWNGIIGKLNICPRSQVWLKSIQILPDPATRNLSLRIVVGNLTGGAVEGKIRLSGIANPDHEVADAFLPGGVTFSGRDRELVIETRYETGPLSLWDELHPNMHILKLSLDAKAGEKKFKDERSRRFGMREFKRSGTQFSINGKTVFLRGTHDACHFPLTGYPSMSTREWERLLQIAKDYGINHIRFHTWCPPEAAFDAADTVGMYLQPELPSDAGFSFGEDANHDAFCRMEGERILRTYGHHPSFVMLALGNEISIRKPENRAAMTEMISYFRKLDPSRLYAEGSNNELGNPTLNPNDDYFTTFRTGPRSRPVRGSFATVDAPLGHIQAGPANTMVDYTKSLAGIPVPVIGHEIAQYTVYPDFREMGKYTGALRLRNYEVFREALVARGMGDQADAFMKASGALTVLCYREEIEAALRTEGFGGFQLLDLVDNQEQGSAIVGILNSFMESKGLIAPETWREFCSPVVPLALMSKYAWTTDEMFAVEMKLANYSSHSLDGALPIWSLKDSSGKVLSAGELAKMDVPQGKLASLGMIKTDLSRFAAPQKLTLELGFKDTNIVNHYPVWVYPSKVDVTPPAGVALARELDANALSTLAAGGTVLLFPPAGSMMNTVEGGFATDFWCWKMFNNKPGTMGILCDANHPALAAFPTEFHSNWQWFPVVMNANPIILDDTPADYRPIVQVIDNFTRVHKLGLIFEARVGSGKLLVCAADLPALKDKPEARQLLASLLAYAGSDAFKPVRELSPELLKKIFARWPENLALKKPASASSSQSGEGNTPDKANDGDANTRWCAADSSVGQWWQVDLGREERLGGGEICWEQNNRLYQYVVEGSLDGKEWVVLSDQRLTKAKTKVQTLTFAAKPARYVRITVTSSDKAWASIREVKLWAGK